jgi:hypothetical protein
MIILKRNQLFEMPSVEEYNPNTFHGSFNCLRHVILGVRSFRVKNNVWIHIVTFVSCRNFVAKMRNTQFWVFLKEYVTCISVNIRTQTEDRKSAKSNWPFLVSFVLLRFIHTHKKIHSKQWPLLASVQLEGNSLCTAALQPIHERIYYSFLFW